MNYFDYAIIGVFALFLLLGVYRGFIKTVLSLISWAISFLLIYLFAKKMSASLMRIDVVSDFFKTYIPGLFNLGAPADYIIAINGEGNPILQESGQLVSDALTNLMFPSFMHGIFMPYFVEGKTFIDCLVYAIADYALMSVATILIVIIVSIFMRIVSSFVAKLVKKGQISMINRAIGGILYSVVAALFICVVMLAIDLMRDITFMKVVVELRDSGIISSWIAKYNPIVWLFGVAK